MPGTSQPFCPQLHHLVSDDVCLKVVELYLNEKKRGAAGGNLSSRCVRAARETSYQWKAERCMADENCFKVRGQPGSAPHEAARGRGLPTQEPSALHGFPGTSGCGPSPRGTTGLVRWAPSSGPSGKVEAWRLGKRGALMTFRPHPVPAWAVLAASGCLSAALP